VKGAGARNWTLRFEIAPAETQVIPVRAGAHFDWRMKMNSFCMPCGPASSLTSLHWRRSTLTYRKACCWRGWQARHFCTGPTTPSAISSIGVGIAVLSIVIFIAYYRSGEVLQGKLTALLQASPGGSSRLDPYQVRSPVYFRARCGGALHDEPSMNSTTTTPSSSLPMVSPDLTAD